MSEIGSLEQAEQVRQLGLLLDLSRQVAAHDSLEGVLEAVVAAAVRETGSETGSLFLHDDDSGELYTHGPTDQGSHEIRIMDDGGIVGAVYQSGVGEIVLDPYADTRFAREVDQATGFTTQSILCAPVKTVRGETIGVVEMLNKRHGNFNERDLALLESMTTQCAVALGSMQLLERTTRSGRREVEFLNLVSELTSELELGRLLGKVMAESTRMLDAERATLFLNDEKTGELFSLVGDQLQNEIRFPNNIGIAGTVFTDGESVRIPYAYADLRFNPEFDRRTGFFTRSILCVPVFNKAGKAIGVTQVLNKRGGTFSAEDESRLRAFTAQIAVGLENAKLFADVQAIRSYNEAMLESMSNGVITFDDEGTAQTCNAAAARILRQAESDVVGMTAADLLGDENAWLAERMKRVSESLETEIAIDAHLHASDAVVSCNVTVLPLLDAERAHLGTMVMIEDISNEKRIRSTLARYMDADLAERLISEDAQEQVLGGAESIATVLFSDIRSFTTIAERLGPHATVAMLNAYFERMVDCIASHSGMLDKFIGDAIMAVFGLPVSASDDEDRALRAAIAMIRDLREWNRERQADGEPVIDMGIGLNTDVVVAGNIGSTKRMDYTIIGDGVNLAARLESACKQYSARILISELTKERLQGIYRLREIDTVIVKGKTEPVSIFECLDCYDTESFPNMMEAVGAFTEGLARYRDFDYERAAAWFEKALEANPRDTLSGMYLDRCRILRESPPAANWDGVWVMSDK